MVVLRNHKSELSYILAELFNKCLEESSFLDYWKVSLVVPVFKNVGEMSNAKNYQLVSLLSVVSKVFEELINNRIIDYLEKCGFFSDFCLTIVSDQIARTFNRSGVTRAVALNIQGFSQGLAHWF